VDRLQTFVQRIFRAEAVRAQAGHLDGDLLTAYVTSEDPVAFEALVQRHAAMVWGVCRRTLCNDHDAEDAFQATFLILCRKAASIKPPGMVGNWLYGVARRAALKAKSLIRRRQLQEQAVAHLPARSNQSDAERLELRQFLDDELSRLPAKYRVPIVLCDLEGLTRHEACQRLGWLEGTLSGRLSRARSLLARRLLRRGFGLSAGVGATSLACPSATSAGVPPRILATVLEAALLRGTDSAVLGNISATAVTLSNGIIRTMFYGTIIRTGAMLLVLATLVGGTGLVIHRVNADQPQGAVVRKTEQAQKQVAPAKVERNEADCIAELYEAASRECDARMSEYLAGRGTEEFLHASSRRLLQAELEKAEDNTQRVAARESHFKRMAEIEKVNKERFEAGKITTQDLESSRFYRCEAELSLLREKKK
jgi:RNA polymerase sigma factor (sigma-70 family)